MVFHWWVMYAVGMFFHSQAICKNGKTAKQQNAKTAKTGKTAKTAKR